MRTTATRSRDFRPCPLHVAAHRLSVILLVVDLNSMEENDMTDAPALPTLSRPPTVVVHPPRIVRLPVNRTTITHGWARRRMAALIRSVAGTKDGPVHSTPQNHYLEYASSRIALAIAVRQQLTEPGSVPAQQQLHLIMADRAVHENRSAGPASPKPCWSPFTESLDLSPHRPLIGLRRIRQEPDQLDTWWKRPF